MFGSPCFKQSYLLSLAVCPAPTRLFYVICYVGESKSKGKIHLMALIEVTVSSFTYFSTQSALQHNAFVISFNWFLYSCGEEAFQLRDVDGRPERPSPVTRVLLDLNLSTHS